MSGKGNTVGTSHAGKIQSHTSLRAKAQSPKSHGEKPQSLLQASRQALGLQSALKIGRADDPYERQADHIADKVVAGETQLFQRHNAQKPQLVNVQRFQPEDKGLQSKAHDTSRADSTAADIQANIQADSQVTANAVAVTEGRQHTEEDRRKPDDRSLQAQEQEREVQAQQEEPLQAQEQDRDVQPQQDEEAPLQSQRKQQEVSTRQEQDQLQQAQAEEREVQAQQKDEDEPLQKNLFTESKSGTEEERVQQKQQQSAVTSEKTDKEKPEDSSLQAQGDTAHRRDNDPHESLRDARQRSGSPLPDGVRDRMERAFAKDFSGVRIHTDDPAVLLNQDLGARALTSGHDIFFNTGEFQPASRKGEHLLAHELTHVVQQQEAANTPAQVQRKQELPESYQTRPELLKALQNARSKIGLVNAKVTDADGNRVGWELLNEFFNIAFGGKHPLNAKVIQKIVMGTDKDGKPKDALPSWCGIFVWWSLKSAGLPIPDWKLGQGVLTHFNARAKGELPRKGDIAYRDENQHFAIVSGVEMNGIIPRIATINGNSAGANTLGGQIQEQWHGMEGWRGFLDTTSKLNLPEAELVTTQSGPDALQSEEETARQDAAVTAEKKAEDAETAEETPTPEPMAMAPVLEVPAEGDEVTTELPDIPPAPVIEPAAVIDPLSLDGSSDQAVSTVAQASASQIALDGDKLGGAVSEKLQSEQQQEMQGAPDMQVNLAGNVAEGMTPADQLMPAASQFDVANPEAAASAPLVAKPHEYAAPAPDNASNDATLDKEEKSEGFFDWLKANFDNLLRGIRTSDPNLNTSAGPAPTVSLDGNADPNQMATQRTAAGNELRGKRDELTGNMRDHPGQSNIQAKAVQERKSVEMKIPEPVPVATIPEQTAADYAEAELPQNVRDKADEALGKEMQKDLDKADQDAQGAAETKQKDKDQAISDAEKETERLNKEADKEQRNIVIDNRKKVADEQRNGIEQAYTQVNNFESDAGTQQKDSNKLISDKVKEKEGEAETTLTNAEAEAENKKKEEEKKAADAKKKLDEERKNESWWDKAKNLVKDAVKAVTEFIDEVFTKLREAVKTIIDTAKNLAISAINAARDFAVNTLNDFRDWAKEQVNTYLGDTFPGIASAINGAIDGVVDVAVAGVNLAADAAIAGVEFVADNLAAALDKILSVYQAALKAAVQIIGAVLTGDFVEALKIAIRLACEIAGIDPQPIFDFLDRAGAQLVSILKKPIPFFNNLVDAVALGARTFVKNIKQHLIKGLIGWLTGALSEVAITLPDTFDAAGIFSLVMQILGLTYANIKARIIKKYPAAEKVFDVIEKSVEVITLLVEKGPAGLWQMVKDSMANIKEIVMGAVRNYVITTVIKEAVTWLLGLLNPAGALVKVLKLLFDLVMFLVERFNQIKDFVMSVYGALSSIASGVIGQAAAAVENAMARSLPVVIGLLASLAGLGGIGKTVQGIIKKVTAPINKVIDTIIDKVVNFAKKLLKKGKDVAKKVKEKLVQWWKVKRKFKAENGESHTLFFKGSENSAVLTMRSEEQPYQNFLNGLDASNFDSTQKQHLTAAKAVAKKIDEKRKEAVGGKDDAEKAENSKKKQDALDALLTELGESTKHLFGEKLPDWEKPTYGAVNTAGFASSMEIKVLTKQGEGWKGGSGPSQAAQATYDILNQRRQSGGASFYIRGHLLNDNLGGPGQWLNMTPLSREGNHQHEAQVESYVKAGFNAKAIQRYSVIPQYSGHGGDATLKKDLKAKYPAQSATFDAIIDAEKNVPVTLKIEASRLVKKGNGYTEKDKKTWNLNNPIQRSADQYFLGNTPKIVAVDVNSLTSAQPLLAFNHADITAQAAAILLARQKRRDNKQPGFGTYSVLARETVDSGGSLTETTAKQWNTDGYILLK